MDEKKKMTVGHLKIVGAILVTYLVVLGFTHSDYWFGFYLLKPSSLLSIITLFFSVSIALYSFSIPAYTTILTKIYDLIDSKDEENKEQCRIAMKQKLDGIYKEMKDNILMLFICCISFVISMLFYDTKSFVFGLFSVSNMVNSIFFTLFILSIVVMRDMIKSVFGLHDIISELS